MKFTLEVSISLLLVCQLGASQGLEDRSIGLSFAAGIGYLPMTHDFTSGPRDIPLRPRIAGGASICYTGIRLIEPTNLEIILEYTYSRSSTNSTTVYYGTFTGIREHSRIMVWPRLIVPGTFSPFVEIGIGFGSFRISEEVQSSWYTSTSGNVSGLVLGGGGGIAYTVSTNIRIDGNLQDTRVLKDLSLIRRGITYKRPGIITIAIRVNYFL